MAVILKLSRRDAKRLVTLMKNTRDVFDVAHECTRNRDLKVSSAMEDIGRRFIARHQYVGAALQADLQFCQSIASALELGVNIDAEREEPRR